MSFSTAFDPSKIPALSPPPGVRPDYTNPSSLKPVQLILDAVFFSIMIVFVAIRLVVKGLFLNVLGWDDYTCVLAALYSLSYIVLRSEQFKYGFGRHTWDIPLQVLVNPTFDRMLTSSAFYPIGIYFAKLSALLLYLRIFKSYTWLRHWAYVIIAFLSLYTVGVTGAAIAAVIKCNGPRALGGTFCIEFNSSVSLVQAVVNTFTDFCVLLLPLPAVQQLGLTGRQMAMVSGIFLTGLISCAASATRLGIFSSHYRGRDFLYNAAIEGIPSIVELNVSIICICLPNVPAFMANCKKWLFRDDNSADSEEVVQKKISEEYK